MEFLQTNKGTKNENENEEVFTKEMSMSWEDIQPH